MEGTPRDDEHAPETAASVAGSETPYAEVPPPEEPREDKPPRKPSRVRFEPIDLSPKKNHGMAKIRDRIIASGRHSDRVAAEHARDLADMQDKVLKNARSDTEINLTLRSRAAELSAAMGISELSILNRMDEAHTLVYAYPATITAVEENKITMQHAKVIASEGSSVDYRLRAEYEARCLEIAAQVSSGRLRAQAKRIAQELQPRSLDEVHAAAASRRDVWVQELSDGMAELGAILPATLAYGIRDRIQKIAKAVKKEVADEEAAWAGAVPPISDEYVSRGQRIAEEFGIFIPAPSVLPDHYADMKPDEQAAARARVQQTLEIREDRNLGTYRADVFAELLLTGIIGDSETGTTTSRVAPGIQASISISIPVGGTATLDGYGPIDSTTARQFAAVAPGWDSVTVTDDGEILSTERRTPTEAMKRVLRARDQHCRFPGCIVPTRSCEIDHTIDWAAGGKTEIPNLGFLCPKHHLLKHPDLAHQAQWRVRQDAGGVLIWTSPLGADYTDRPDHTLPGNSGVTNAARATNAGL